MTYPIDQPFTLTFRTYSDAAKTTPGDATTVTLDLRKPDGTEVTYTLAAGQVTRTDEGVYVWPTPAGLTAGTYAFHWHSTGDVATSLGGGFTITDKYVAGIVSLDEAKAKLDIDEDDDDDELQDVVNAASRVIEGIVGPCVPQAYSERHRGTGQVVALNYRPALSVSLVTEHYGSLAQAVTEAATPDVTGTHGFVLDGERGLLVRYAGGALVPWQGEVWVTYVAGRTDIPANVRAACLEQVRHMWETQRGRTFGRAVPGLDEPGYPVDPAPGGLAPRVWELLADMARADGFA